MAVPSKKVALGHQQGLGLGPREVGRVWGARLGQSLASAAEHPDGADGALVFPGRVSPN